MSNELAFPTWNPSLVMRGQRKGLRASVLRCSSSNKQAGLGFGRQQSLLEREKMWSTTHKTKSSASETQLLNIPSLPQQLPVLEQIPCSTWNSFKQVWGETVSFLEPLYLAINLFLKQSAWMGHEGMKVGKDHPRSAEWAPLSNCSGKGS